MEFETRGITRPKNCKQFRRAASTVHRRVKQGSSGWELVTRDPEYHDGLPGSLTAFKQGMT